MSNNVGKNVFPITERQDKLIRHQKTSKFSKGEFAIANFLKENNVSFYRNFFFKEFTVNKKLKLLFFDFYLIYYNACIEFDGEQHYTRTFNGIKMKNSEANDFMKNAFCKKNNIPLLRIKYNQFDNIESIICSFFDKYL